MKINLKKLGYTFWNKPLVVGGKAMEYYGLRESGKDTDLVVSREDFSALVKKYPTRLKDLWGDFGVCPFEFEIWKTIAYLGYEELSPGSIDCGDYLIVSLEKLLLMKVLGLSVPKYRQDVESIADKIKQNKAGRYKALAAENQKILDKLDAKEFIEKRGPESQQEE